jgi:dolichol kinase
MVERESLWGSLAIWVSMLLVLAVYVGTHGDGMSPALSVVFFSSLALSVI